MCSFKSESLLEQFWIIAYRIIECRMDLYSNYIYYYIFFIFIKLLQLEFVQNDNECYYFGFFVNRDRKVDEIIEYVHQNLKEAGKALATLDENFEHDLKVEPHIQLECRKTVLTSRRRKRRGYNSQPVFFVSYKYNVFNTKKKFSPEIYKIYLQNND